MLLINKPKGMTSFDVIRILRKRLGIKKIGHAGTLDPLAEGLLIVLVGKEETRLASKFLSLPKTYETIAILGIKTDSGDLEGKIVNKRDTVGISEYQIKNALSELQGTFMWEVPAYSAVKVKGKPLYKYARENIEVNLPQKEMQIYDISIKNISYGDKICKVEYSASVSSGTYIRTLNEKLGEKLNIPSTTGSIRRISIGDYNLSEAIDPYEATLDLMVPAL